MAEVLGVASFLVEISRLGSALESRAGDIDSKIGLRDDVKAALDAVRMISSGINRLVERLEDPLRLSSAGKDVFERLCHETVKTFRSLSECLEPLGTNPKTKSKLVQWKRLSGHGDIKVHLLRLNALMLNLDLFINVAITKTVDRIVSSYDRELPEENLLLSKETVEKYLAGLSSRHKRFLSKISFRSGKNYHLRLLQPCVRSDYQ